MGGASLAVLLVLGALLGALGGLLGIGGGLFAIPVLGLAFGFDQQHAQGMSLVMVPRGTWAELQALRTEETFGDDPVFPMSAVNAWKRVKRAARIAGITELPVSPRFLRHSHGTHALRRGADLATVRDTLGHESIATTSRYLHARPEKSSGDYLAL